MKYIKKFNESKESIESICEKYGIENYTINRDGTIDVDDDVNLTRKFLKTIPLKFNKVSGNFTCNNNQQLISLEGCPKEVGGFFNCCDNRLTSLEGCPEKVGGNFDCSVNKLTSLEGSPKKVGGYFKCANNKLTSLEGSPEKVGGNADLIQFDCGHNNLTSVRGLQEDFEGHLYTNDNPIDLIFKYFDIKQLTKVAHLLNEYDVISFDGKKIYMDNLEEVFDIVGVKSPTVWIQQLVTQLYIYYEIH